ncbi:hypothetical protein F5Y04DRAFT_239009 [Hypomontagnella monticulosa]|nr:hypothetical protein F5Y04DRAFT_239009 [Hypomontagnella monticulosa]
MTTHQGAYQNAAFNLHMQTFLNPIGGGQPPALPPTIQHDQVVICVVCGGICKPTVESSLHPEMPEALIPRDWMHPWLVKAKPGFYEWTKQPHTARAYGRQDDDLLDLIPVRRFIGGPNGFTTVGGIQASIDTSDAEMFLPIHYPCFEIAKTFSKYQSRFDINFRDFRDRSGGSPSSIAHLYEIWMKRALMTKPGHLGPLWAPIDEPHKYFGALMKTNLLDYALSLGGIFRRTPLEEQDPSADGEVVHRAIFTNALFTGGDHTEPEPEMVELRARIERLPPELQQGIFEAMEPFDDLGPAQLRCTRVLPPSWWRDALFSGDLFPWLFELQVKDVAWMESILKGWPNPDWELLCRKLAQPTVFKHGGALHGCSGLENRHRIWRLLNSARLGHLVHNKSKRF